MSANVQSQSSSPQPHHPHYNELDHDNYLGARQEFKNGNTENDDDDGCIVVDCVVGELGCDQKIKIEKALLLLAETHVVVRVTETNFNISVYFKDVVKMEKISGRTIRLHCAQKVVPDGARRWYDIVFPEDRPESVEMCKAVTEILLSRLRHILKVSGVPRAKTPQSTNHRDSSHRHEFSYREGESPQRTRQEVVSDLSGVKHVPSFNRSSFTVLADSSSLQENIFGTRSSEAKPNSLDSSYTRPHMQLGKTKPVLGVPSKPVGSSHSQHSVVSAVPLQSGEQDRNVSQLVAPEWKISNVTKTSNLPNDGDKLSVPQSNTGSLLRSSLHPSDEASQSLVSPEGPQVTRVGEHISSDGENHVLPSPQADTRVRKHTIAIPVINDDNDEQSGEEDSVEYTPHASPSSNPKLRPEKRQHQQHIIDREWVHFGQKPTSPVPVPNPSSTAQSHGETKKKGEKSRENHDLTVVDPIMKKAAKVVSCEFDRDGCPVSPAPPMWLLQRNLQHIENNVRELHRFDDEHNRGEENRIDQNVLELHACGDEQSTCTTRSASASNRYHTNNGVHWYQTHQTPVQPKTQPLEINQGDDDSVIVLETFGSVRRAEYSRYHHTGAFVTQRGKAFSAGRGDDDILVEERSGCPQLFDPTCDFSFDMDPPDTRTSFDDNNNKKSTSGVPSKKLDHPEADSTSFSSSRLDNAVVTESSVTSFSIPTRDDVLNQLL